MNNPSIIFESHKSNTYFSLKVNASNVLLNNGNNNLSFSVSNLSKIQLTRKKRLVPLLLGAITASFTLIALSMHIVNSLNAMGTFVIGALLFYYGSQNTPVISFFKNDGNSKHIWLTRSINIPDSIITYINIFLKQKRLPELWVEISNTQIRSCIIESPTHIILEKPLIFNLFYLPPTQPDSIVLSIDVQKLTQPVVLSTSNKTHFAEYKYAIPKQAVIKVNEGYL